MGLHLRNRSWRYRGCHLLYEVALVKTLADLTSPVAVVHTVLEADLRATCVDWARRRLYWARKFSSISQRSVPDYLFRGRGIDWFTEFKRPETKPKFIEKHGVWVMSTEAQYEEQLAMRAHGWRGFECDDFEKFKTAVIAMEKGEWP